MKKLHKTKYINVSKHRAIVALVQSYKEVAK